MYIVCPPILQVHGHSAGVGLHSCTVSHYVQDICDSTALQLASRSHCSPGEDSREACVIAGVLDHVGEILRHRWYG